MDSTEIILFVGLPGSGKTYWANNICDTVIDNIPDLEQLPNSKQILGKKTGITCVDFCKASVLSQTITVLQQIYGPTILIQIVYFENDGKKARANVKHRDGGRVDEATIRMYERIYEPPFGALKIWEP